MSYLPPTRKEAVIVLVSTLSFLLLTAVFIGLRPEHIARCVAFRFTLYPEVGGRFAPFRCFCRFVRLDAGMAQLYGQ